MEKADPEENEELEEEVNHDFVVDDYVEPTVEDAVEAAEQSPTLLWSSSPNSTVQDQVHTNTVKATKRSGNEPPYNCWLELIDQCRGMNKAPLKLSEILRAKLETVFPIVYCSDPEN